MAEGIALLTNKTFLMRKTTGDKWEDFIDITKYPQIGGEVETIEVTRLRDTRKRYINGLEDSQSLTFEANYTKSNFSKLNDDSVTKELNTYRLCFGDNLGTDGCWEWTGMVSAYIMEGESNAARKMGFTISDEGDKPISEVAALTAEQIASAAAAAASEPGEQTGN